MTTYYMVQQAREPDITGYQNVYESMGEFPHLLRSAASESDPETTNRRAWIYADEALARREARALGARVPVADPIPSPETKFERRARLALGANPDIVPSGRRLSTASDIWREIAGLTEETP